MKTLAPQLRTESLILDPIFQLAIKEQAYGKIKDMIADTVRHAYLDFSHDLLNQLEKEVRSGEELTIDQIRRIRDGLNITRNFKPL